MNQNSIFSKEKCRTRASRCFLSLAVFSMLFFGIVSMATSCKHDKKQVPNKVTPGNESSTKDVLLKTFTIKGQNARAGTVRFQAESLTIEKKDVKLEFQEADMTQEFTCSPALPVAMKAGEEKILTFSTVATEKYKAWKQEVKVKCTNLHVLEVSSLTVHGKTLGDTGIVVLPASFKTVEAKDVSVTFKQPDAPSCSFEGLPLTLEDGKEVSFTVSTASTEKYEAFKRVVKLSCSNDEVQAKDANLKTFTIKEQDAKAGELMLQGESITIEKKDVKLEFQEADMTQEFTCSPALPVAMKAGEEKTLTFSIAATKKYKAWKQDVKIKCTKLDVLKVSSLTVHGKAVRDNNKVMVLATLKKIEEKDVQVTFKQSDAPSCTFEGLPLTLEADQEATFTISTTATEKYEAFSRTVTVVALSKSIDDCVKALGSQVTWKDTVISSDLTLPTTVEGFEGSTVSWNSRSSVYCSDLGKILRKDIVNVTVEMEAMVSWQGDSKTETFRVNVERLKKITEKRTGVIYTVDLSEDNVLRYREKQDNKPEAVVLEFKIDKVDVDSKQLVATLAKLSNGPLLQTADERIQSKMKNEFDILDKNFNQKYFALRKNNDPHWQDIDEYLKSAGYVKSDATLTEAFNKFKDISEYTGTQPVFIALPAADRKVHVKKMLDAIKTRFCENAGLDPSNVDDEKVLETIKSTLSKKEGISVKHHCKQWAYTYILKKVSDTDKFPDGYSFEANAIFDSNKEWFNQLGGYSKVEGAKKSALIVLESEGEMKVQGNIDKQENIPFEGYAKAGNTFKVPAAGGTKELTFTVTKGVQQGEIAVSTAGDMVSDTQMNFVPSGIFAVLGVLP